MDRPLREIELDLLAAEEMMAFHGDRLSHYREQKLKFSMELNRARRLEREGRLI